MNIFIGILIKIFFISTHQTAQHEREMKNSFCGAIF